MTLLDASFLITGAGALYAATVTAAALVAMLARTPQRRRDALKVLRILGPPLR